MIDLQEIMDRINGDAALQKRFIADPAGVLEAEGIRISPPMLAALKKLIKSQTEDEPEVKGSGISKNPTGPLRLFGQL